MQILSLLLVGVLSFSTGAAAVAQTSPPARQQPAPSLLWPAAPQLPSTPTPTTFPDGVAPDLSVQQIAPKWQTTINPDQEVVHYSAVDKLNFAFHEQISPTVLIPATISAGWASLLDAHPKYGSDSAGYGERFGASMLRGASGRILGDGVLAVIFRQDPRYYRVAHGSLGRRVLGSVEQTFVRRNDAQHNGFNWSGATGHLVASALQVTYYPQVSASGEIAAESFALSFAGDAAGKLFREFLPDLFGYLRSRR